jgi:putative RNA 2'-phosphotransferase
MARRGGRSPGRSRTAATAGARRGQPVILAIDAAGMHARGHEFFRAANGVWLTAGVPPGFIAAR